MAVVQLKKRKDTRIESGHPWIYQSEIQQIQGEYQPGDIVDVVNHSKSFVGRGYINPRSIITVRLLTREERAIDQGFFDERIQQAWTLRQELIGADTDSYRLIHAESDGLPALVVDKFGDYLVVQFLSLGMDIRREPVMEALMRVVNPKGIYERSDVNVRKIEGLPLKKGHLIGEFPTRLPIVENGFSFIADIENGQKTGYFFDQRENRQAIKRYVKGKKVLDCFCYVGSFAVHAAGYGAAQVRAIDISEDAIADSQKNMELNGFSEKASYLAANVFDELRTMEAREERYDVIILDPPAFTKSKDSLQSALRGYKEINLRAMKILEDGGYLITSSCSHHVSEEIFWKMLLDAARDAGKSMQILERRTQGADHPILLASKETQYLKYFILKVAK